MTRFNTICSKFIAFIALIILFPNIVNAQQLHQLQSAKWNVTTWNNPRQITASAKLAFFVTVHEDYFTSFLDQLKVFPPYKNEVILLDSTIWEDFVTGWNMIFDDPQDYKYLLLFVLGVVLFALIRKLVLIKFPKLFKKNSERDYRTEEIQSNRNNRLRNILIAGVSLFLLGIIGNYIINTVPKKIIERNVVKNQERIDVESWLYYNGKKIELYSDSEAMSLKDFYRTQIGTEKTIDPLTYNLMLALNYTLIPEFNIQKIDGDVLLVVNRSILDPLLDPTIASFFLKQTFELNQKDLSVTVVKKEIAEETTLNKDSVTPLIKTNNSIKDQIKQWADANNRAIIQVKTKEATSILALADEYFPSDWQLDNDNMRLCLVLNSLIYGYDFIPHAIPENTIILFAIPPIENSFKGGKFYILSSEGNFIESDFSRLPEMKFYEPTGYRDGKHESPTVLLTSNKQTNHNIYISPGLLSLKAT